MFSGHSPALPAGPRNVCVVAGDGDLLICGSERQRVYDVPVSSTFAIDNVHGSGPVDRSECLRLAVEALHRRQNLDEIVFPARGGLGFRAIQAKQARLAFADVTLTVRLDSCHAWERHQAGERLDSVAALETDFIERYAFEKADRRDTPVATVYDFVRAGGWQAGADDAHDTVAATPLVSVCVPFYNMGAYLPDTLAALAGQTYSNFEVTVIDDGSTDPQSCAVFTQMKETYPQYRFVQQVNSGIGATRNRGLAAANGTYFIPVDADNIPRADMIERFVNGIHHRPHLAALTCYFLAFADNEAIRRERYLYACRPLGGCLLAASLRNVYGDANAIYRTTALRAVGGYETDRNTSFEDWEAFVKLARANYALDVLPDYLFYYRHLQSGFSRITNAHANHDRVLRQFRRVPALEQARLWDLLVGLHQRAERLEAQSRSRRYHWADRLSRWYHWVPSAAARARQVLLGFL